MSEFVLCESCATPLVRDASCCPTCCARKRAAQGRPGSPSSLAVGALLGLSVSASGCSFGGMAQDYGVAETGYEDLDGDGYSSAEGDCDDEDENIHPDAEETPGDGVDSNCDGEDDT